MSHLSEASKITHLRLARTKSVGPVTFRKLIEKYGDSLTALNAILDGPKARNVPHQSHIEEEMAQAKRIGANCLFLGTPEYPAQLAATDDAPPILYALGNIALLTRRIIAIVGARNASAACIKLTKSIAAELSANDIITVSGLARGIDGAAHTASLKGGTIACLAGGLDIIYPYEHEALYRSVKETGLIVSEMPTGIKPQARHFPRRNRIISGLSSGVLIVEAAMKSGSLITARFAADQGRDIYAVPGSPLDPRSGGTNQLIKDGAILVRNATDILAELPSLHEHPVSTSAIVATPIAHKRPATPNTTEASDLLQLLGAVPMHIDELVKISGHNTNEALVELQLLELDGKIERHSGSRFSRIQ